MTEANLLARALSGRGSSKAAMVELVARCSEATKHLKPVMERLRSWPCIDRPHPVERVPITIEQRLGRAAIDALVTAYRTGASTR